MEKFLAIFETRKPFSPQSYPELFRYLASIRRGIRFRSGVVAIEHEGDSEDVYKALAAHLSPQDEVTVFELHGGYWHLTSLERSSQLEDFLR